MSKGKVWLVGAGPSDAGLFTLKGKGVLERAEVVFYDRLVGQGVLAMIPQTAEQIDVGKRAGHHPVPQEEINRLILEKALEGRRVVRLKGGDPFLFGRGAEELVLLNQHEIAYEIVPGITSAVAVPAYSGIPVTHRNYASSLHIVTAHKKENEDLDIDFKALAAAGGTCVFLMGLSALSYICSGFIEAGMRPDMPAAVLAKGTSARQQHVTATLATLEGRVRASGIQTPALIAVGEVCGLSEQFSWYEKLPLAGCKVVVTRPKEAISSLARKLRDKGAEVVELPSIKTVPLVPGENLDYVLEQSKLCKWLVFTSPAGVNIFFDALQKIRYDIRAFSHMKIAVIGAGSRRELEKRGMYPDCMPKQYDGQSLGKALAECCGKEEGVLIPRARIGNQELITELKQAGIRQIIDVPVYDTEYDCPACLREEVMKEDAFDYAVFTSASTVRGFVHGLEGMDFTRIQAVCIGSQTEQQAKEYGMKTCTASEATIDALVEAIERKYTAWN